MVIHFEISNFSELSVKKLWPLAQENADLVKFLPDLKDSQLPEKEFFFGVLNTLMPDEMRMLLADATKSRAPQNSEDNGDLIELNQEFVEKVDLLFSMKSKEKCWVTVVLKKWPLCKKSEPLCKKRPLCKKKTPCAKKDPCAKK